MHPGRVIISLCPHPKEPGRTWDPGVQPTSWWHESLRYKVGESLSGDPLARLVWDHLSVTGSHDPIWHGRRGVGRWDMKNSNEEKLPSAGAQIHP